MGLMSERLRIVLGILILLVGFFYPSLKGPAVPDKFETPEDWVVALVDKLPEISDPVDANKLAATFAAMSEGVLKTDLKTNLQVQYFLDEIGKKTMGNDLVSESGEKKYPDFSPAAAELITEVIGPQTETEPLAVEEIQNLSKLFYGFAWKLYDKSEDSVYEEYFSKAEKAIAEYNNEDDNPEPVVITDCICEGKGYVVHGDGHKTDCPCIESGESCKHNPKCGSNGEAPPVVVEYPAAPVVVEYPCEDGQCPAPTESQRRGIFKWLMR
jgi:hypothetical protein